MKFCVYCGKQLEDNQVCDCVQAAPAPAPAPAPQPQPQASPYAQAQGEISQKFGKAMKNTPVLFSSFWKNPEYATGIAKKEKDFAISGVFSGIFFIAMLLYNVFFFASAEIDAEFGRMLGSSIVMTAVTMALYIFAIVLCEMLMVKRNFKDSFLDAFIDFSVKSIPASILLVVTGISGFISEKVLFFLLLLTIIYFVVVCISAIIKAAGSVTDSFVKLLVLVALVTIAVVAFFYGTFKMFMWTIDLEGMFASALGSFM